MLVAKDADDNVVATLDYCVALDKGKPVGLIDFEAHEAKGGKHTDIWHVSSAVRSHTTPRDKPHQSSTATHLPLVGR